MAAPHPISLHALGPPRAAGQPPEDPSPYEQGSERGRPPSPQAAGPQTHRAAEIEPPAVRMEVQGRSGSSGRDGHTQPWQRTKSRPRQRLPAPGGERQRRTFPTSPSARRGDGAALPPPFLVTTRLSPHFQAPQPPERPSQDRSFRPAVRLTSSPRAGSIRRRRSLGRG